MSGEKNEGRDAECAWVVRELRQCDGPISDSQGFLEVGETKATSLLGDLFHQAVREGDVLVVLELVLPVLDVKCTLLLVRVVEQARNVLEMAAQTHGTVVSSLFAVKAARTIVESGVKPLEMVGGTNEQYAVIAFQTVQLVQEERPIAIVDERIEVLEDQHAGCHLPSLGEDL